MSSCTAVRLDAGFVRWVWWRVDRCRMYQVGLDAEHGGVREAGLVEELEGIGYC